MLQVSLKWFADFLVFRTVSNKYSFRHLVHAVRMDVKKLFVEEVLLVFDSERIQQMESVEKQLKKEGITIGQCNKTHPAVELQTLDELTAIIFRSKHNYCLMMVDFPSQRRLLDGIHQNLFGTDEQFKIERAVKGRNGGYEGDWFFIRHQGTAALDGQACFRCDKLIKLDLSLRLNLRTALKVYMDLPSKQLSLAGYILAFDELSLDVELFLQIDELLTIYMNFTFKSVEDLVETVKMIYRDGFKDCIDFGESQEEVQKLELNEFIQLKPSLSCRMKKFEEDLNIAVGSYDYSKPKIDNLILAQNMQTQQNPQVVKDIMEAQRIKGILLFGKQRDILTLQEEWANISDFFADHIRNWSLKYVTVEKDLKTITKIMDYRMNKFRVPLPEKHIDLQKINQMSEQEMDAEVEGRFFYLNDSLYPKMKHFIEKFGLLLNLRTIKQKVKDKYSEYKKDAKIRQEQQRRKVMQQLTRDPNNRRTLDLRSKKERLEDQFEQYNKILNIVLEDARKDLNKQNYEENVLDKLMMDYFAEVDSLNKGKGYFYVKIEGFQKKELREFIGEIIGFQQKFFDWQDVFNIIILNVRPESFAREGVQKLLNGISMAVYSDTTCLGCTQYFVLNRSVINKHNRVPLRVFSEGSIGKRLKGEFMEDVCSMLNNSGGILLFNCNKYYGSVLPKGAYLTNRDKSRYVEEIQEMIGQFHPRVELNKEIVVSFVPIVVKTEKKDEKVKFNRYEQPERDGQYFQSFSKIQGFYIMRIKVRPLKQSVLYIWGKEDCQYNMNGLNKREKKLKISQLHLAIKLKLSKYPQEQGERTSFRPKTHGNPLNHQCKAIHEEPYTEGDSANTRIKQNLEKRYKFISMIVVKEQNINKIDSILKDEGYDIFIKTVFQEYRFGIAKYTAALFHNEPFSEILQFFINCKDLVFDGKRVLSIFITDYLKIDTVEGFNHADIGNACQWLSKEFPQERLKYFQLNSSVPATAKSYYIKTETKLSTLFMYYVFNHYKIKTVFKNPPTNEMDRLSAVDLETRRAQQASKGKLSSLDQIYNGENRVMG